MLMPPHYNRVDLKIVDFSSSRKRLSEIGSRVAAKRAPAGLTAVNSPRLSLDFVGASNMRGRDNGAF